MTDDFMGDMKQKSKDTKDKGRDMEAQAKDTMDKLRQRRSDEATDPDVEVPGTTAA